MSFVMRPARDEDLQPLYEMAKLTGGGFTNLPADKAALKAKIERSQASLARQGDEQADDLYVLVLENGETKEVRGTCQIFTRIGQRWPFYSYRISTITQTFGYMTAWVSGRSSPRNRLPATAPVSPTVDPTDRSMPPLRITISMPSARIALNATCLVMVTRLPVVR